VVPAEEIGRRLTATGRALAAAGLDGAVIVGMTNLAYLSGTAQTAHLVVRADGAARLCVRRVLERARRESPLAEVVALTSLRDLPGHLRDMGLGRGSAMGMELDVLPAASYLRYQGLLDGCRIGDCARAVREVRATKTAWELERMRRAAEQVRAAAAAVPALIAPGTVESDVQLEVERALRRAGHQGQLRFRGFNQEMHYGQVLAGPSGAVPGYSDSPLCGPGPNVVLGKGPDGHVLRAGDPVIADLVGGHEGYLADQTRTFSVGELPADLAEAHAAALAILRLVEAELRPGVAPSRLYALAEEAAGDAGLADAFMGAGPERVRFLGHGVGLEIDELPVLAPGFDDPIAAGTTVAVEPKFVFPGRGAVGVENTYAVGEDGPERLTTAPEELIAV
jgi:Xaa-Pro aminopeptidase